MIEMKGIDKILDKISLDYRVVIRVCWKGLEKEKAIHLTRLSTVIAGSFSANPK